MLNFISIIGFAITLWHFFNDRIKYEERLLIKFFGNEYINYKNTVPILIPCKMH